MKEIIKQAQQYFTEHLLAGEFEIKSLSHYTVRILIDGYEFTFWIANGKSNFRQYSDQNKANFIELELSEETCNAIWDVLTPKIEEVKQGEYREQKLKELEQIKSDLGLN